MRTNSRLLATLLVACAGVASSAHALPTLPGYGFSANRAQIFYDRECFKQMLKLVQTAQKSVRLDFYIFGGAYAERIADVMIEKHRAGMDVRVMFDRNLGSVPMNKREMRPILKRLEDAGVPVRFYTDAPFTRGGRKPVDHNKVIVVDGERAAVGSTNFSTMFWDYHDLSVEVAGPIAGELAQQFDHDWAIAGNEWLANPDQEPIRTSKAFAPDLLPALAPDENAVRLLSTGPGRSNILPALVRAIGLARESIDIQMHEIDEPVLERALIRAHERGVKVRALLDPWSVVAKFTGGLGIPEAVPSLRAIQELKRAGIDVRVYVVSSDQITAHMKSMLIDGSILHVGSANWAFGSWEHIAETNLEIHGGPAADGARTMFESDWATRSRATTEASPTAMWLFHIYAWARTFIL